MASRSTSQFAQPTRLRRCGQSFWIEHWPDPNSFLADGRQSSRWTGYAMKLAALIARPLQAGMRAELHDLERAAAAGTKEAGWDSRPHFASR
jgi:hypothetical protein